MIRFPVQTSYHLPPSFVGLAPFGKARCSRPHVRRGAASLSHAAAGIALRAKTATRKLARSPPVRQGKKLGGGFGDIKEEEVTQNDPVGQVEEPEERSAEAGALRASVVAQRKGIIPEDSADAPTHPIARGRRVRASREEIAKIFRPPVGGESMLQRLRRRMSKETTTAEASATGGS